ncbi:MAG: pyridoxal phosphate-dependent aminotransferase [Alphaproteobacteria bacterium]
MTHTAPPASFSDSLSSDRMVKGVEQAAADAPPGPGAGYRDAILDLPPSALTELTRLGVNRTDILPLWFGETDIVTPPFICEAAARAMAEGMTFYGPARGLPALREAIVAYTARHYGMDVDIDRVSVPGSAMLSINIVLQCLVGEGDRIVIVTPQWANISLAAQSRGAEIVQVPQTITGEGEAARWTLDLDRLFDACTPGTKALFIGSPANPTGYMTRADEQRAILDMARRRGIAVIADEVYARLAYGMHTAPSYLPLAGDDEPVFIINSFSKIWAMTGWRIGWLTGPRALGETLLHMAGFNNTGVPPFLQHGAIAALEQGEDLVASIQERCATGLAIVEEHLGHHPRIRMARPEGAFYAFIEIEGVDDSIAFAKALFHTEHVGVAPGAAFGPGNENRVRLCFARRQDQLREALERLTRFLDA